MSEEISSKVKKIVADHLGIEEAKVVDEASFIDDLGVLVVCEIDVKKFFFFDSSFTKVVFPAPEGDERIIIVPLFFKDI